MTKWFQLLVFFYLFAISGRGECARNVANSNRCRWQSLNPQKSDRDCGIEGLLILKFVDYGVTPGTPLFMDKQIADKKFADLILKKKFLTPSLSFYLILIISRKMLLIPLK